MIAGVIGACEELGVADDTYFFYSVRVHLVSSPTRQHLLIFDLGVLVFWGLTGVIVAAAERPRFSARGIQHPDGQAAAVRL